MSDGRPPPPSDDLDLSATPGYRGDTQIVLNAILIAFSTIFVGLRLYARCFMVKRPGLDDIIAVIALGALVALSVMEIKLVEFGSGTKIEYVGMGRLESFFQALATQSLLYFWCVCLMRLHIAAFLPHLHNDKRYLRSVYVVAALTLISTLIFFFIKVGSCKPVSALWLPPYETMGQCMSEDTTDIMMNIHSALGIVIDISLVALPIWVIHTKMMFSGRKFRVILIFAVGIFVIITGLVRFILIRITPFNVDATYSMSTIGLWTDLEGHVGLWCGCFPAFQPILRAVFSSLGLSRLVSSYKGSQANHYGQSKPTSGSHGWNRSNAIPLSSRPQGTNAASDDASSQKGIFNSNTELPGGDGTTSPSGIVKNTQVEVFYEQRDSSTEDAKGPEWDQSRIK
ncbi:hypothetical protein CC79DRAFT_1366705 [Sarocladium strictum]